MFPQNDSYINQHDDNNGDDSFADIVNSNDDGDSGDSEETGLLLFPVGNPDASELARQLAPDNIDLRGVIQALVEGDKTQEIPDDKCPMFKMPSDEVYCTCSLFKPSGERCAERFERGDRFKHHVQAHLGITPYSCEESDKVPPGRKCDRKFFSIAARDTHIRNKNSVSCRCGTTLLPKNLSRHRKTCKAVGHSTGDQQHRANL